MEMGDITRVRVPGEGNLSVEQIQALPPAYTNSSITRNLNAKASSASGSVHDEEKVGTTYEVDPINEPGDNTLSNLYPFPELRDALPEVQQFTVRAVFIGCCLGSVVSASNICKSSSALLHNC